MLSPSNVRRELAAICQGAGVTLVTANELRHSCASLLSDIGVPNEQIADLLGHTTDADGRADLPAPTPPGRRCRRESDWLIANS